MAKVKEYSKWDRIVFQDRVILKSDLSLMSFSQINKLNNLEVKHSEEEDGYITLVV